MHQRPTAAPHGIPASNLQRYHSITVMERVPRALPAGIHLLLPERVLKFKNLWPHTSMPLKGILQLHRSSRKSKEISKLKCLFCHQKLSGQSLNLSHLSNCEKFFKQFSQPMLQFRLLRKQVICLCPAHKKQGEARTPKACDLRSFCSRFFIHYLFFPQKKFFHVRELPLEVPYIV